MTVRPHIPSTEDVLIDAAVRHVVVARDHLQAAIYKIDDAGYQHDSLNRAYSFTAGIVAEFNGRVWRPPPPVPAHIAEAAIAWRAERERRRR
ncbi:hypothetical protein [Mesorhizobium captivum]|uniref:hypothetical protein n=1 Tax=Mesorhizobium captivum TaxID=3072319 RepID=UPI002A24ACA4|nr:hypothetical protein [Mesorhizobium sp. VK3C]MDX8447055.1 hypothetical protein [Mesorhizobium sp. VK3C]